VRIEIVASVCVYIRHNKQCQQCTYMTSVAASRLCFLEAKTNDTLQDCSPSLQPYQFTCVCLHKQGTARNYVHTHPHWMVTHRT